MTDKAVPVLASLDLARTRNFYRYFGFEPVGGEPGLEDTWLRLKKGGLEIDFSLSNIDYRSDEHIRHQPVCLFRVADVAAWHEVFAGSRMGWKVIFPSLLKIRDDIWDGSPAFCLTDRDGNLLWFIESDDPPEPAVDPDPDRDR